MKEPRLLAGLADEITILDVGAYCVLGVCWVRLTLGLVETLDALDTKTLGFANGGQNMVNVVNNILQEHTQRVCHKHALLLHDVLYERFVWMSRISSALCL